MVDPSFPNSRRAIRTALARERYARDEVRVTDPDLRGFRWLVASHRGIFAASLEQWKTVIHGWFFGICRAGDDLYLFENCNAREPEPMGRIVRLKIVNGQLSDPAVIAKGLHNNCHQIRMIDGLLCVMDTANQAVVRFHPTGRPYDVRRPFPPATPYSRLGDYLHMNSIAKVGEEIAILLHKGTARPEKQSEVAWLDRDWSVIRRDVVPGRGCHDIVEDETGVIWNCASMSGEIVNSNGRRVSITNDLMTRGLAISDGLIAVGVSTFGARHLRETLNGGLVVLNTDLEWQAKIDLPAGPTDIAML